MTRKQLVYFGEMALIEKRVTGEAEDVLREFVNTAKGDNPESVDLEMSEFKNTLLTETEQAKVILEPIIKNVIETEAWRLEEKAWEFWQPERDFGGTRMEISSTPEDLHTPNLRTDLRDAN